MNTRRLWIVLLILLAATVTMANLPHGRKVDLRQPIGNFPMEMAAWHGIDIPLEASIAGATGADTLLNRSYTQPGKRGQEVGLYIGYYKSQQTGDLIHSPKNCLPGTGWRPLQSSQIPLRLANGSASPVNLYIVENGQSKVLVLYWYQSHGRVIASEYWAKIYMVLDAIRLNRTDSALVRIATAMPRDEQRPRELALAFAEQVAPQLDEFLPR